MQQALSYPKPILLTGSIRSGGTWAGSVFGQCDKVRVVHEPMNPYIAATVYGVWLPTWFLHPPDWSGVRLESLFEQIFRPALFESFGSRPPLQAVKRAVRLQAERMLPVRLGKRVLLKDPIAIFASPWLASRYSMDVVVMVRHPCAYVLSALKQPKFVVDIKASFSNQESLRASYSTDTLELMHRCIELQHAKGVGSDPVFECSTAWRCFYEFVTHQLRCFPDWKVIIYETIARDSIGGFQKVFAHLGLPFADRTEMYIRETSMEKDGSQVNLRNHVKRYDARAASVAWKRELSAAQQSAVNQIAGSVYDSLCESDSP